MNQDIKDFFIAVILAAIAYYAVGWQFSKLLNPYFIWGICLAGWIVVIIGCGMPLYKERKKNNE